MKIMNEKSFDIPVSIGKRLSSSNSSGSQSINTNDNSSSDYDTNSEVPTNKNGMTHLFIGSKNLRETFSDPERYQYFSDNNSKCNEYSNDDDECPSTAPPISNAIAAKSFPGEHGYTCGEINGNNQNESSSDTQYSQDSSKKDTPPLEFITSNSFQNFDDDSSVSDDETESSEGSNESSQSERSSCSESNSDNSESSSSTSKDVHLKQDGTHGKHFIHFPLKTSRPAHEEYGTNGGDDESSIDNKIGPTSESKIEHSTEKRSFLIGEEIANENSSITSQNNTIRRQYEHDDSQENNSYDISLGDLKEIMSISQKNYKIDFDSDFEFLDEEKISVCSVEKKSCVPDTLNVADTRDILSTMLEINLWDKQVVYSIIALIWAECDDTLEEGKKRMYPLSLPSAENSSFWIGKVAFQIQSIFPQEFKQLRNLNLDVASKIMYDFFRSHLCSLPIVLFDTIQCINVDAHDTLVYEKHEHLHPPENTRITRKIFLGNIQASESRLALAALEIKWIVLISSFPLKKRWTEDGVEYITHMIASAEDVRSSSTHKKICNATKDITSIIESDRKGSILMASANGEQFSSICYTLYMIKSFGLQPAVALGKTREVNPHVDFDVELIEKIEKIKAPGYENDDKKSVKFAKMKRVLSCQLLSCLSKASVDKSECSHKKMRSNSSKDEDEILRQKEEYLKDIPTTSFFSSGTPVINNEVKMKTLTQVQGGTFSITENLTTLEKQLRTELEESSSQNVGFCPVPLLTPPSASPKIDCMNSFDEPATAFFFEVLGTKYGHCFAEELSEVSTQWFDTQVSWHVSRKFKFLDLNVVHVRWIEES